MEIQQDELGKVEFGLKLAGHSSVRLLVILLVTHSQGRCGVKAVSICICDCAWEVKCFDSELVCCMCIITTALLKSRVQSKETMRKI